MAITRARKTSRAAPKKTENTSGEITPEQFIAGAGVGTNSGADKFAEVLPRLPVAFASHEAPGLALVKRFLPWAMAASLFSPPGINLAALIGVQVRMLAKLCEEYGMPFREDAAISIAATSMATALQNTVSGGFSSPFMFVPALGRLLGWAMLPAIAAASTCAIGKVFIAHFEVGGSFLDFDTEKVHDHFRAEFEMARRNAWLTGV